MWRRSRALPTDQDARDAYKNARNRCVALLRSEKAAHFKKKVEVLSSLPAPYKQVWSWLRGMSRSKKELPPLKRPDGSLATSPSDQAALFASVLGPRFSGLFNIPDEVIKEVKAALSNPDQCENVPHITCDDVYKALKKIRSGGAPGEDGIPPHYLKIGAEILSPILIRLFESSLHSGHIPTRWLSALVQPIPKSTSFAPP